MRRRFHYRGRILDILVYAVRGGGWTSHFDIENYRPEGVLVTHCETGQVFSSPQLAQEAAVRLAVTRV